MAETGRVFQRRIEKQRKDDRCRLEDGNGNRNEWEDRPYEIQIAASGLRNEENWTVNVGLSCRTRSTCQRQNTTEKTSTNNDKTELFLSRASFLCFEYRLIQRRGTKKFLRRLLRCSPPRKSLVKGERFIRDWRKTRVMPWPVLGYQFVAIRATMHLWVSIAQADLHTEWSQRIKRSKIVDLRSRIDDFACQDEHFFWIVDFASR